MKIQNRTKFIIKHFGYAILVIGVMILITGLLTWRIEFTVVASIILITSMILQIIGFKEPIYFLVDEDYI